mgnify:CR=1 FL=1
MKKLLGYGFAILIGVGAITFEMLESLNFWSLAFPAEKWYLAYLGFFLTSIAMLGYFYEFLFTAVGKTQKTVAIVMMVVCGIGALLTAGMGFQITSYEAQGFQFSKDELAYMAIIVQGLIAVHIIALFIYYGGDAIAQAWKDDDGDGTPNFLDPDYKPKNKGQKPPQNQPMHSNAAETELIQLREENARLKASQKPTENPTDGGTK